MLLNVIHKKIFFLSIALIAFSLPFSIRATSFCTIVLILNWIIEGKLRIKILKVFRSLQFWIYSSTFLIQLISLLYSSNKYEGLFSIEKKLSLFIFPLVFFSINYCSPSLPKKVISFFTISCFLGTLVCFIWSLYAYYNNYPITTSVFGAHVASTSFLENNPGISNIWYYITYTPLTAALNIHPTYFSIFISFIIIYILFLFSTYNYSVIEKILLSLLLLYFVFFLILLANRNIILSLTIVSFIYIVGYFYKRGRLLVGSSVIMLSSLAIIIALYLTPVTRSRFFFDIQTFKQEFSEYKINLHSGLGMRLAIWKCSLACIRENAIFGVGLGDSQDELNKKFLENGYKNILNYNCHNQYLQLWLAAGVLGILSVIISIGFVIFRKQKYYQFLFLNFILIILLISFTEVILSVHKGIVFYSFFNSLLGSVGVSKK